MLAERFNALRVRLDALLAGGGPAPGLWRRARAILGGQERAVELASLAALDEDLERAGVHTAADARLLRELGATRGRLAPLAQGLEARARSALEDFEAALDEVERQRALDAAPPGLLRRVETDFVRLARVVKVAAVFSGGRGAQAFELYPRPPAPPLPAPAQARLAVAEFLAARAASTVDDSTQKRRDLDLAHELVLRMSADAGTDRDRLRRVRVALGAARERVRTAPPVRTLAELVQHLRHVARSDPPTAYRSLESLYERAVEAGDAGVSEVAAGALAAVLPPRRARAAVEQEDARRLVGWRGAPPPAGDGLPPGGRPDGQEDLGAVLAELAFELGDDQRRALALAAGVARSFDVEDALGEEVLEAETRAARPVERRVPYPTQRMGYEFTGSLEEFPHFVLTQPHTLLLDLAAGRQMVRAYLAEEPPPHPKRVKRTAVRVYVLDASGSMHGARARFRDAILIAELNAIRIKARAGLPFDPLYFSFFNDRPTELQRVDSGPEATRHLERLFQGSAAEGQTDITLALQSAFESIGRARGRDPYLARATAVLVTDGEDGVDLDLVRRLRQPFHGVDIALSFLSLGEENPDLKALVLEQRQHGGRAFYHHLSDAEVALAPTEFDSTWRTLYPAEAELGPEALEALLPHLEALEAIARGRPAPALVRADSQFDALFPLERPPLALPPSPAFRARLGDLLDAVAEAAPLAPSERRASEAVALLTHLLRLYGVPVPRYLEAIGEPTLYERATRLRLICRTLG